jgi:hyperosmotically inducible periplasmic protein
MNTMKRYVGIGGLAVALVLSLAAISSAQVNDSWITMKTKVALMTTSDLHTTGLNIDTKDGAVTLQGKVESEAEKAKAESVARTIDGVKGVKNLLQVVPKSMESTVDARDEDIEKAIKDAFSADKLISDSGISVGSVNKGVVLLTGKTKSMEAHLRAVETAAAVRGVRHVSTDVVVEPAKG